MAAVSDCLALPRASGAPWPDLGALAEAIAGAAEVDGCWFTVAGNRFGWGVDGPAWSAVVEHSGEAQGVVAVCPESAGPLGGLAAVLGPVFAAARLAAETDDLRRAGDAALRELADARWRAAADMDRERRGLERDLHDGAQHHLVALRMAVGLLEHAVAKGGAAAARPRLDDLLTRLDAAEALVGRTAAGILPLALVDDGLAAALVAELAEHADVALDLGPGLRRYPAVAESAVYFVCMEAVNNAHKHAPGARITVRTRDTDRGLEFEVRDDGPGFDRSALPADSGLHNLNARAAAVGGSVRVTSAPGRGTVVAGFVPL
ncbi:histidine kinase/DNA gyrase B/HSP90-like ATPase [Actinokineospora spheciospongiae]|nr:histidine kinase/DNA gyrase B/HSP90-like ATPase [Actinokineospora spheciospongiae]